MHIETKPSNSGHEGNIADGAVAVEGPKGKLLELAS
jgi:hypothetical protein